MRQEYGPGLRGRWMRLLLAMSLLVATAYQTGVVLGQISTGATFVMP